MNPWADQRPLQVFCSSCEEWSPPTESPDEALDWAENHECVRSTAA